ncbi:hypothetical protein H6F42_19745 [Pseudanabaena sp. FACHB-1998]|uniref:salt stress protein, Slr1339 family n=1 Tax=Pseudanabaena sp. FACHB-1998 TaxID=2692858 RepID=UPI0016801B3C|nr:hypothetical protein [Pseudanabaena sp. FACHB-1998]MBD2179160.1 hypothetical protein [Pseudanabaena sp. FACHB-1998]
MESLESILTDLQVKYQAPESSKASPDLPNQAVVNPSSLDRLLTDLRNNSSNESKALKPEIDVQQVPPVGHQAINHDLQQVADRQKVKEQQQFTQQATEWLKILDPLSGEGLWFEGFAKNYPSRLEAAIALIAAK